MTPAPRLASRAKTPLEKLHAQARRQRRHKFNAKLTQVDGIWFDSKREADRWEELRMLEGIGDIHDLRRQPIYPLWAFRDGEPEPIGVYRADFVYCSCAKGEAHCDDSKQVVEDVKGFRTALYRWKKKHVEAQYGITITEI